MMRIDSKIVLIFLVVFLLGTNVAVVLTYQNHLKSETKKTEKKIVVPDTQLGRFFYDELKLDADQQDQFRKFRRTYNQRASKVMRDMEEVRTKMVKELDAAHPNRSQLDELADQLGEKHKKLKGLTFDYYFNMQSVLNEEQQQKMVDIFQAMLTEEGNAKQTVPGNMNRRGQGRGPYWRSSADSVVTGN